MNVINKVKWQLLMRLPGGGIYEKCKSRLNDKDSSELLHLFNGDYLNISILEMYLKGYYSINKKDIYQFYLKLLKLSCVKPIYQNGNLYYAFLLSEQPLILKAPNMNNIGELSAFRFELLDLVFPYLITSIEDFNKLSFNEGPYEYVSEKISLKVDFGDTVFDLGANFGMFSAYAASKGCNVYAFEPLDFAVSSYLENLISFYPNITIINSAVSDRKGYTGLCVDNNNFGGSFINNSSGITVPLTTIDDFVSDNNIKKVDFIKADIEGAECQMLGGASLTLKEYAPKIAICKYHHLNDERLIKEKILSANENYIFDTNWKKIYARVRTK